MNVVLMAGGGGSRLWPVSRQATPKQFLDLGDGKTLIEQAYARAAAVTSPEHIYVATSEKYQSHIEQLLPHIPAERVFYEPEKRDTTAAFASVALRLIAAGQGQEPTVFMWSDHVFTHEKEFVGDLKKIPDILRQHPESIVILGHVPISPETTLGYFEVGDNVSPHTDVFHIKTFKEKPDLATAEQYVAAGSFFWNLGYFSTTPQYLIAELTRLNPELSATCDAYAAAIQSGEPAAGAAAYHQFPKQAIEYTLIEKTPQRLALTGDYGWSDVGNWAAVKEIFGKSGDHMPAGHHVHVDSQNNYVYNATNRVVSTIGLKNTIVVVTDDAVLVADKDHAHRVKEVVQKLEEKGKSKYL